MVVDAYGVMFETIQNVFAGYTLLVIGATVLFFVVRRFPPGTVPWIVFVIGLGDGVFLGALTVLTGGFESILYWVYPALIVLNAVSIPLATPQIVLNLLLGIFFLSAGLIEASTEPELSLGSLRGRLTKKLAAEDIEKRFRQAKREIHMARGSRAFDQMVINDNLDRTICELEKIIEQKRTGL